VEFAVLVPLLIMIMMGIIEFGWLMSQQNDVRHGAREAARLAAVDAGSVATMGASTCDAMDLISGATITFTDGAGVGTQAQVEVSAPVNDLTGFPGITTFLPANLESTVRISLEQPSDSWGNGTHTC
jgi:Flp pilus assembly protein TadG